MTNLESFRFPFHLTDDPFRITQWPEDWLENEWLDTASQPTEAESDFLLPEESYY
jgi:hypothetical protein